MKIKKILTACLVCCGIAAAFTSCSKDDESYYTVSDDNYPRILNTDFPKEDPDNENSAIKFTIKRNENLRFEILVTPADMTTVKWLLDDKQIFEGTNIDMPFEAGSYKLKIVAVTVKGKESFRDCKLEVQPLDEDPQPANDAADRVVKAGAAAQLHGTNMSKVKKVVIDGQEADATYNAVLDCVEYTVPTGLGAGTYRLSVIDSEGVSYGGNKITIVTGPTLLKSVYAGTSKSSFTVEGYYLDQVASITIDGKECTITSKSDSKLTLTAPELEKGDYEMKGTSASGSPVLFCKDGALQESGLFLVSEAKVVWSGNHYVSWALPDGDPNKEWRGISQEEFAKYEVGHLLTITLKIKPEDTYHQYQIDDWDWASLPGQTKTDLTQETTDVEVEITQELKDRVAAKAFCIHGHGFFVTLVTYK